MISMINSRAVCSAAILMILGTSGAALAELAYSFEGASPPDGFGANGGGTTVTQDTIGTTDGQNSMKVDIVAGATFVGALTGNVAPAIGDPPGVAAILYDLTIDTGQEFAGGFADMGVTIFGASQPDYPGGQQFGLQAQFADFQSLGALAAGTYRDLRIDLDSATNPLTMTAGSFNDIFGTFGSGQDDLIPTGFQFFFSKSNDEPLTVYIDNVRTIVPEPAAGWLACLGLLTVCSAARRRR